jgi:hypothetical protein
VDLTAATGCPPLTGPDPGTPSTYTVAIHFDDPNYKTTGDYKTPDDFALTGAPTP